MCYRWTLILLLISLVALPAEAGILFGRKKDKPDPRQRVPQLVSALKSDKDSDVRCNAAEELREYDPAVFPEIVPALIDALHSDQKAGVRIEAAHSLSKLRPVSQTVGDALERAVAGDSSMRVRLQARSALLQYHWAGYRGKKGDVPLLNTTREPPISEKDKAPPVISTTPGNTVPQTTIVPPAVTPLPLLPSNQPRNRLVPTPPNNVSPLLPPVRPVKPSTKEPPLNELPPVPMPRPEPKQAPKPGDNGPDLQ